MEAMSSLMDAFIAFLHMLMATPFFYPLLSLVIVGDAICPLLPSETILNLAGAFSASQGVPDLKYTIIAAIIGGVVGDNICFALGGRPSAWSTASTQTPKPAKPSNGCAAT